MSPMQLAQNAILDRNEHLLAIAKYAVREMTIPLIFLCQGCTFSTRFSEVNTFIRAAKQLMLKTSFLSIILRRKAQKHFHFLPVGD